MVECFLMGYSFHLREGRFRMPASTLMAALDAIKAQSALQRLSWTEPHEIGSARTFFEALDRLGWYADIDQEGNVCELRLEHEKIGDEDRWLAAIAPYVEAGSYLECTGEDADVWRWVFDGDRMVRQAGRVVFE